MSIIQDLYKIYDGELTKYRARRSSQHGLLREIQHNLAFLREGLREGLDPAAIIGGLENARFGEAARQGLDLERLQKKRLAPATYGDIREFARYRDWTTTRLVETVYERIATLKKLARGRADVDRQARLRNLFKLTLLLLAHIGQRKLVQTAAPAKKR